jgi:signal transduction histidine kinase
MRGKTSSAYRVDVSDEATPTLASLAQARARHRAILRVLRPLAICAVVLVTVATSRSEPKPALSGEGLGVVLALLGFAFGIGGVVRFRPRGARGQAPFLVVLVAAASALVWLQPHGPGFVGVFVAAGVAAMRVGTIVGAAALVVALGALAAAAAIAGGHSWTTLLLGGLGIVAVYVIARLAARLREEQEQAERLLLELDRNREAQERALVLSERQRLAREMHDVLAHSISGLVLQLEGARLLAEREGNTELAAAVERAHGLAKAGLVEARGAIATLRDEQLPGPERLPELAREFEHDTGVPCRPSVTGTERELASDTRLTVYRVAQEALTNVRKHAAPSRVELRLAYEPEGARLTVEDVGGERWGSRDASAGYGLTGMRERADLIGGRLTAGPTDAGFRVELWVPA